MATDLTKRGIRIAKAILFNPEDQWLADEQLKLMFDCGLMNDTEHVLQVIEEENAQELIPIIYKQLKNDMLDELKALRGN